MSRFDPRDPGTDPEYCRGLSGAHRSEKKKPMRFCPTCKTWKRFDDPTLLPYCSPGCRMQGEDLANMHN